MGAKLLTAKEIARGLNVRPSTITEWGRQGKIPRVKVSHKIIRYDQDAVLLALSQAGKEQNGGQTQ
jgi:predicted site-specific integrase-resolvase